MDAFSKVIDLAGVRGSLDLRCLLSGHFALDHEPASTGEAPFHLVLAGRARMQLPDGETLALEAGDFVLLPRGSAHLMQGAADGAPARFVSISTGRCRYGAISMPQRNWICCAAVFCIASARVI